MKMKMKIIDKQEISIFAQPYNMIYFFHINNSVNSFVSNRHIRSVTRCSASSPTWRRSKGKSQRASPRCCPLVHYRASTLLSYVYFSPLLNSLQYCCSVQADTPSKLLLKTSYQSTCRCICIVSTFVLKETSHSYNISHHVPDTIFKPDTKMLVFHSHSIDQPEREQTLTTIGWRPHIYTFIYCNWRHLVACRSHASCHWHAETRQTPFFSSTPSDINQQAVYLIFMC